MTKTAPSYVKEKITKSLLSLMEKEIYREITVLEIVQNAQVGRASFYRNYTDKDDVIRQHINWLIEDWKKDFDENHKTDFAVSLWDHFYVNKEFYLLIYRSNLSYLLYECIKKQCGLNVKQENIHSYITSWYAGGIFGWIDEWITRGMNEPPTEMIRLYKEFEQKNITPGAERPKVFFII